MGMAVSLNGGFSLQILKTFFWEVLSAKKVHDHHACVQCVKINFSASMCNASNGDISVYNDKIIITISVLRCLFDLFVSDNCSGNLLMQIGWSA